MHVHVHGRARAACLQASANLMRLVLVCLVLSETGSAITSTCIGLGNTLTPPAGQAGKPVPGYNGMRKNIAQFNFY